MLVKRLHSGVAVSGTELNGLDLGPLFSRPQLLAPTPPDVSQGLKACRTMLKSSAIFRSTDLKETLFCDQSRWTVSSSVARASEPHSQTGASLNEMYH